MTIKFKAQLAQRGIRYGKTRFGAKRELDLPFSSNYDDGIFTESSSAKYNVITVTAGRVNPHPFRNDKNGATSL